MLYESTTIAMFYKPADSSKRTEVLRATAKLKREEFDDWTSFDRGGGIWTSSPLTQSAVGLSKGGTA